jgi:hypothetical protein
MLGESEVDTESPSQTSQPSKEQLLAQLSSLDLDQAKQVEAAERRAGAGKYTASAKATVVRYQTLAPVGALTHLNVHLYVEAQGDGWETDYDLVCSDRVKAMIEPGASFDAVYDPSNRTDVDIRVPPP